MAASRDQVEVRVGAPCAVGVPSGLVAWWPGNGNFVDAVSGVPLGSTGAGFTLAKVANGFVFDGVNDWMKTAQRDAYNVGLQSGLTMEFWIRPSSCIRYRSIRHAKPDTIPKQ